MVKSEVRPAHADAFGSHAAILAWDVFDEPDSDGNFAAYPSRFELFDQFKTGIRQHDEVRPRLREHGRLDPHGSPEPPVVDQVAPGGRSQSCMTTTRWFSAATSSPVSQNCTVFPKRRVWAWRPPAERSPSGSSSRLSVKARVDAGRMRTARETRVMAYSALVHGGHRPVLVPIRQSDRAAGRRLGHQSTAAGSIHRPASGSDSGRADAATDYNALEHGGRHQHGGLGTDALSPVADRCPRLSGLRRRRIGHRNADSDASQEIRRTVSVDHRQC